MTLKEEGSIVVYEVAINDHPLVVGEDDDRSDEELIQDVEERTEIDDDLDFPGWTVMVSDPPDMETLRYVHSKGRINVRSRYDGRDVFDEVAERIHIDDFDMGNAAMSCPSSTHEDDFEGDIHLDLAGGPRPGDEVAIRTDDGIIHAEVTGYVSGHGRPEDGARMGGTLDSDSPEVHYVDYWRVDE